MAFTYDPTTNLGRVRLLVADTDAMHPIYEDSEIQAALDMEGSLNLYVSGMAQPSGLGATIPVHVYSVYRSAALLLRSLAANKSRLSSVIQLLDVKLSPKESATALRETAQEYMEMEQNSGAFAIAESAPNEFAARERIWKQAQRVYA